MSTTVNRQELAAALRALRVATGQRPALPILNNVAIAAQDGALTLITTNLEVFAVRRVEFEGDTLEVTVPAKAFGDFVDGFSGDTITLTVDGPKLRLASGRNKASLSITSNEEFPALPVLESAKSFTLDREEFNLIVDRVTGFAATDSARPILTGVQLFGNGTTIRAAAADNYRVGVLTLDHQAELDVVVPAAAFQAASKVLAGAYVNVTTDGNAIQFSGESGLLLSRLIAGQYPNIEPVLPAAFKATLMVPQSDFASAAKLAAIASAVVVRCGIDPDGGLRVTAQDYDTDFEADVPVTVSPLVKGDEDAPALDDIKFALGQKYVTAIASLFGGSTQVEIGWSGPLAPVDFRDPSDPSFRAVVMPVRTTDK